MAKKKDIGTIENWFLLSEDGLAAIKLPDNIIFWQDVKKKLDEAKDWSLTAVKESMLSDGCEVTDYVSPN